jgi:hypothetical protein
MGAICMEKRKYTRMKLLEAAIDEMLAQGKTHREIEEHFGLQGDRPLHSFLKNRRRKERKLAAGVPLRPQGRQPKGYKPPEVEKDYEIKRLKMENELLRDFLRFAGRR